MSNPRLCHIVTPTLDRTSASIKHGGDNFHGIQILRALCAIFVVLSHENGFLAFPEYFGFAPLPSLHVASLFAVAAFFCISGFIISVSSLDINGRPLHGRREFFARRAARILPFLWFCTLLYNGMSWLGTGRLDSGAMLRTLLVSPWGELKPNVAWSIRHELIFYLLFGFTIVRSRQEWFTIALWCIFPLMAGPLIWYWSIIPERGGSIGYDLFKILLAGGDSGANLDFGVGLLAGLLYRRMRKAEAFIPVLNFSITILLFILFCALVQVTQSPPGPGRILLWAVLAGVLVLAAMLSHPVGNSLPGRVLCQLGDSSFSLYLMHNTIMLLILAVAKRAHLHLTSFAPAMAFLVFCVVLSILACEGLYRLCERPLTRWARGKLQSLTTA